jgi:hypothetical protein
MWIWIGQMKITIAKLEGMFAVCKQKDKTEIFVNRRELPFDAKGVMCLSLAMITSGSIILE